MIATAPKSTKAFSSRATRNALPDKPIWFVRCEADEKLTPESFDAEEPEKLFREGRTSGKSAHTDANRLLTPEGERYLFRKFNFYKGIAEQARCRKNGKSGDSACDERMAKALEKSRDAQNHLIEANRRLVLGLARKYARSEEDFEELVSEGNLILLNTVEKFDYSRGYRFSTYATHAIQHHFFRVLKRRQRRQSRELLSTPEILSQQEAAEGEEQDVDPQWAQLVIERFEECLNPRERAILVQRFGLDGQPAATLQTLADNAGLSKERVRQLQMRAIKKLQTHLASRRAELFA